jgi:hypothetical protein
MAQNRKCPTTSGENFQCRIKYNLSNCLGAEYYFIDRTNRHDLYIRCSVLALQRTPKRSIVSVVISELIIEELLE